MLYSCFSILKPFLNLFSPHLALFASPALSKGEGSLGLIKPAHFFKSSPLERI
jgi:hypothetical protein